MDALLPQGITYLNTVVDVCKIAQVTYPSGKTVGVEVGLMSLGGSPLAMQYNPPLTLYVNGLTSSNTFGLHIGSAQYNYTGSLIFGGYDRGRVIGPVLSYDARSALGLLDINIRVETGASPFSFESRDNLLQTPESAGITQPVQSFLKPEYPYMFLPQLTIEAIANNLPIHFDSTSGFWLWDTKDPNYKKIVSSPAYLGFVFPSLSGNTLNETIKVSFSLLNLDLESSVSGLDSTVKYFPVMRTEVSQLTAYPILLGRAFMQATFTGTNWSKNISWLAQAPGPGATREGLGYDPIDLDNGAQTLDVQTGDNLFSSSWAGHWYVHSGMFREDNVAFFVKRTANMLSRTVLSADGSDDNDGDNNGNGLSGGAIAGIVVGVVGGLAIIGGIIAFLLFRRRRRTKPAELQVSEYRDDKPTQLLHEAPNQNTINELDTSKWHEADGTPHSELPGNAPAELPATNK
jgi:hypothetical protein